MELDMTTPVYNTLFLNHAYAPYGIQTPSVYPGGSWLNLMKKVRSWANRSNQTGEYTNCGMGIIHSMLCVIQVFTGPALQSQSVRSSFKAIHQLYFTFSSITETNIAPARLNQEECVVAFNQEVNHLISGYLNQEAGLLLLPGFSTRRWV
jgi:hypothetical protein